MLADQAEVSALRERVRELESLLGAEPKVREFRYTPEGGIECEMEHWAVRLIAASLAKTLLADRDVSEANYVTMTVHGSEIGPVEVTVRKQWGGKTPADTIRSLKDAIQPFLAVAKGVPENWPAECPLTWEQFGRGWRIRYEKAGEEVNSPTVGDYRNLAEAVNGKS